MIFKYKYYRCWTVSQFPVKKKYTLKIVILLHILCIHKETFLLSNRHYKHFDTYGPWYLYLSYRVFLSIHRHIPHHTDQSRDYRKWGLCNVLHTIDHSSYHAILLRNLIHKETSCLYPFVSVHSNHLLIIHWFVLVWFCGVFLLLFITLFILFFVWLLVSTHIKWKQAA